MARGQPRRRQPMTRAGSAAAGHPAPGGLRARQPGFRPRLCVSDQLTEPSVRRRDRWTSGWCSRRRRSARIRRSSAISPRRPRDSATAGCWYTTMCSAPCTPTAIRRCPARTPSTTRSTSRSCCSASSPPARRRSSSGSPCSSCRSGRPPWWPSRPPKWTCSPPAGWCLPSAPAGTTWSTKAWPRLSRAVVGGWTSRWTCCACCGGSRWSTTAASFIASTGPACHRDRSEATFRSTSAEAPKRR